LALAPHVEKFIAAYFDIASELDALNADTRDEALVAAFGEQFVKRWLRRFKAGREQAFAELDLWLDAELESFGDEQDSELAVARFGMQLLKDKNANAAKIERLLHWCALARELPASDSPVAGWSSFQLPGAVDPGHLVPAQPVPDDPAGRLQGDPDCFRPRDGFALTDSRMNRRKVLAEADYCIFCHDHDGDFCAKGFPENKKSVQFHPRENALGVKLTGCPLEEKISEMNLLKRDGSAIGALAMAMADNPMIPATGHRICNDCMKACIYQKKEPVNIPEIETRVLTDVLDLPWGVEIYDLLTRWNPLRKKQFRMQPDNGRQVLISGMGPAGFTMAHHLTMEGCTVTGIDGLKIEPLPAELLNGPVRDFRSLTEKLDRRLLAGFGGVAEYGITVRWDKNFLRLIYLVLARRRNFRVFGGVRLGGTLTIEDAWTLGFDHLCIAHGAGLPRVIPMENSLARGMRQASDFLMALQLTGAAKQDSLANLQVRMPAVVIGGGLTAIDAATEVQAYYVVQVEKLLQRFETLATSLGEEKITAPLDEENGLILEEFLQHGRQVRREREQAEQEHREPDFTRLLRKWGGVTVAYRRGLNQSPAYLRNHEEVIKALEEGIYYAEGFDPVRAELDEFGHVSALLCHRLRHIEGRWLTTNETTALSARTILVAAGTFPNIIYENEHPGSFRMEHDHFLPFVAHKNGDQPVDVAEHCKVHAFGPFTSYQDQNRRVSFIGDTHPVFNGSVVKAITSAAHSYPEVMQVMEWLLPREDVSPHPEHFLDTLTDLLTPVIAGVREVHPMVTEIQVRAPLAARNFQPGQFFRLQTFESSSPMQDGTRLQIPLQTVSGAGVDGDRIRLMLLRWGANAQIAARLQPGDPVVLMGPTGAPSDIPQGKTVLVVAGSWGAAVMLDLGPALRAAGNRVLYFAAYGSADQIYAKEELERTADSIIWSIANGDPVKLAREADYSVRNPDMVTLIEAYGKGELQSAEEAPAIPFGDVDEILVMGSTGLLAGLQKAFQGKLKRLFKPEVEIRGAVGSPMQCMLKGVCGQCLQWQIDPETGDRTRAVFSCAQQDQPLLQIDLDNLIARQNQNRLMEHITNIWVDHLLVNG
ncbi:MAG: FAD-dependent oxidoreductase, partial [Pseudomonadota bacterium]|nr:FAD-dependent oxidoreductase [Pseudomonadota bacterium]